MFFNEEFILQLLLLSTLIFLWQNTSPLSLWLLSGFFLFVIGLLGLSLHLDVLVGFLWVIDLGVGLILLIFLAHLTPLFETSNPHQNQNLSSALAVNVSCILLVSLSLFGFNNGGGPNTLVAPHYLNYYTLFNQYDVSILNALREAFFYTNVWGFYTINLLTCLGLIGMIIFNLGFTNRLKRASLKPLLLQSTSRSPLLIRDQNFIKQQQTTSATRMWIKPYPSKSHYRKTDL